MIAKPDSPLSCATCRFFDLLTEDGQPDEYGLCLRNPPQFVEPGCLNGGWPIVQKDQWCGEHRPDDLM